jgi:adenosylmethionine-8-amino-7-oxononanoate aminotransferase
MAAYFAHDEPAMTAEEIKHLKEAAKDHLWLHFTHHSSYFDPEKPVDIPIIVRGEGHTIETIDGEKKFDGLSGLFCVNVGHGRSELAEVAAKQMMQLEYFPLWSFAHVPAIKLAEKLSYYAPGKLPVPCFELSPMSGSYLDPSV